MEQIASFNGLRFFMALIIVLVHIGTFLVKDYPFRAGYLSVEVFFILSGFLLTKTYDKITQVYPSQKGSVGICKSYACRRFIRLWPEYFFAILLVILLLGWFAHINTQPFFLNVFMLAGLGGIPCIENGMWFVSVIFWCSCLLFSLLGLGKEKTKIVLLPLIGMLCLFYLVNSKSHFDGVRKLAVGYLTVGTIRGLLGLIVGIYTYWGCKALKSYKAKWRPQFVTIVLLVVEIISVLGLGYALIFSKKYNISLFNVYFYASFLIGILYFQKEKLLKFLSWKIWGPLANISYSLYLVHFIVIFLVKEHYWRWIKAHVVTGSILIVLLSIMLAFFNYYGAKYLIIAFKKVAFKK